MAGAPPEVTPEVQRYQYATLSLAEVSAMLQNPRFVGMGPRPPNLTGGGVSSIYGRVRNREQNYVGGPGSHLNPIPTHPHSSFAQHLV